MPAGGLPNRTRAALDPRSTGIRTGLHGACLTAASLGEAGKTHQPKPRETRFRAKPSG